MINIDKIFGGSIDDVVNEWKWKFGDYISDVVEIKLGSVFEILEKIFFYLICQKFANLNIISDNKTE